MLGFEAGLRNDPNSIYSEAMYFLDTIDAKTGVLLQYIAISFGAALFASGIFLYQEFSMSLLVPHRLIGGILICILLTLAIASMFALSCVEIFVGHEHINGHNRSEYEQKILSITIRRRFRYRVALYTSFVSIFLLFCVIAIFAISAAISVL